MRKATIVGVLAVLTVVAVEPSMAAQPFAAGKANVMREFDLTTRTNKVGVGVVGGTTWLDRIGGANDAAGWNDESPTLGADDYVTHEWTLAGERKLGSFSMQAQWPGAPAVMTVEYWNAAAGAWTPWATKTDSWSGTVIWNMGAADGLPVITTSKIRYIASGPSSNPLRLAEFQVFLDSSVAVTDGSGYNWFTQDRVTATSSSPDTTVWQKPNGGNSDTLRDAWCADWASELKAQTEDGRRAYVTYSFDDKYRIDFATLGGTRGQGWSAFEVYTSNDPQALAALPDLASAAPADIVAAGWTKQYAANTGDPNIRIGGDGSAVLPFTTPGSYQHMIVVWTGNFGSMIEMELYANAKLGGDANQDGKVDFADYLILEASYGSAPGGATSDADFDDNGVVEFADYLVLEANFGAGAVPEPMTLTLLGLGGLALIRRR